MISIGESSVPFRALLGVILSVVKTVSVEPNESNLNMKRNPVVEG